MQEAAIYARYSTEEQRATSLDDQVRRCRELASRLGLVVPDEFIFTDAAVSGTGRALAKRAGYLALIAAWESGKFQAVLVDEVSRLCRDGLEAARLQKRVEDSGVRLVTADGLDSAQQGWQLYFGIAGVIGAHFLRETKFRVVRGMQGQLERGYQIADAPFGYTAVREVDSSGNAVGTRWEIDEPKAAIVREMYQMRRGGQSLYAICKELNTRGIKPPRRARDGGHGFFRPATIRRMLDNTIYKGTFVWNGSSFTKYKARRAGTQVESVEYARPELRIVDDETWTLCSGSGVTRIRGGRKHVFSGITRCGDCGSTLALNAFDTRSTLHCEPCYQAVRVGAKKSWIGYTSSAGLRTALLAVMEKLIDSAFIEEFRARLRRRLEGDRSGELEAAKAKARRTRSTYEMLLRVARDLADEDGAMERELRSAALTSREAEKRVRDIQEGLERVDRATIERQLAVDPRALLEHLFDPSQDVGKVQVVLQRLFPRMALVEKLDKYTAVFEIVIAPGAAFAQASGCSSLEDDVVKVRAEVYGGPRRPVQWQASIEVIEATKVIESVACA